MKPKFIGACRADAKLILNLFFNDFFCNLHDPINESSWLLECWWNVIITDDGKFTVITDPIGIFGLIDPTYLTDHPVQTFIIDISFTLSNSLSDVIKTSA